METIARATLKANLLVGLTASGLVGMLFDRRIWAGFSAGAALMILNMWMMTKMALWALGPSKGRAAIAVAGLIGKLGLLFAAVWLCVRFLPTNLYALGFGLAVILASTVIALTIFQHRLGGEL